MLNNVYVVYNRLSCRYGDVLAFPTDSFAITRCCREFQRSGIDLSEVELCRIGAIDVETGLLRADSAPVRIPLIEEKLPLTSESSVNLTTSNS